MKLFGRWFYRDFAPPGLGGERIGCDVRGKDVKLNYIDGGEMLRMMGLEYPNLSRLLRAPEARHLCRNKPQPFRAPAGRHSEGSGMVQAFPRPRLPIAFSEDAAPTELVKLFGRWFYRDFAPPGLTGKGLKMGAMFGGRM